MESASLVWCDQEGCTCGHSKLADWQMFDVPVTFSVSAPTASAAEAYVRQTLESRLDLYTDGLAYERDHAFVDGHARVCDCNGH